MKRRVPAILAASALALGAVQATAAGIAVALGGVIRDAVTQIAPVDAANITMGYVVVYSIEIVLLLATLAAMAPLVRRAGVHA